MRAFITSISICFLGIGAAKAQKTFSISPNDTIVATAKGSDLTIFDIYQKNTTDRTIVLKWSTVSYDIPTGWDYSMCDKGTCYPGLPGGTMADVIVGDSGFLGLNLMPNNLTGTAVVRCYVYDDSFPTNGDTVTWIVQSDASTGVSKISHLGQIELFPNPAVDVVHFSAAVNQVEIMSLSGVVVFQAKYETAVDMLDVKNIQPGVYIIKLQGAEIYTATIVRM